MRQITHIVIHCTAGFGNVESIKRFWRNQLGWKSPGYHIIIDTDGTIHFIAPLTQVVNGVLGFNKKSVHIAYIGGVDKQNVNCSVDTRTEEQKKAILTAILEVIMELKVTQPVDNLTILGHRDFSKDANGNDVIEPWERIKECPSFDAIKEYGWIVANSKNKGKFTLPNK